MPSKPKRDSQSDASGKSASGESSKRKPMPFEPSSNRKQISSPVDKADKKPTKPTIDAAKVGTAKATTAKSAVTKTNASGDRVSARASAIPDAVSRRMVKRMALFCGIPTALGMSSFFISYFVVSHDLIKLPTTVVLLVSLGFFGLGVLGLSYGVLSASWDEEVPGSKLGWAEFRANWKRMTESRRSQKS